MLVLLQEMKCKCPPTGMFWATLAVLRQKNRVGLYWRGASNRESTVEKKEIGPSICKLNSPREPKIASLDNVVSGSFKIIKMALFLSYVLCNDVQFRQKSIPIQFRFRANDAQLNSQ